MLTSLPDLHSGLLFLQMITLNVVVNTYNSGLLVLLVSNQFVELKSNVFKKFSTDHLFQMSCAGADMKGRIFCAY